jgi:hypothetical protein
MANRRRDRKPGVIPNAACLGRHRDAYADAVDRRRAKARDRKLAADEFHEAMWRAKYDFDAAYSEIWPTSSA